jgi:hypothetical protein
MVRMLMEKSSGLGYGFVPFPFLPPDKDEYWQRFEQNRTDNYRRLTSEEITGLEKNRNRSNNWDHVLVRDGFNADLVINCRFYGLVRVGKLTDSLLQYHDLTLPCGLYDSTFISCDLGDHVAVHNVHCLSHYIIGSRSILFNIDEMTTTNHSKFGNGIVMEGEEESVRISIEVANENGNRDILAFEGILPGDGWLWSKYRDKPLLQEAFRKWTNDLYPTKRGRYGTVGTGSTIKSCRIIKDVKIGPGAYIKGANKLKNLTIASTEEQPVQIGEGVELVNGIIQRGSRIFYGVKAIRFILGEESQLKYGARLINSFLGANSTISCCEVLNALIFPFHEQHHNNSFLIAVVIKGQSNIAAGATVGSNHNSRGADGEITAGRGFWPGLNVSLKHNSRFAPFTLISKGSYPSELDIELPFSLIANEETPGSLMIMPGYWFFYNMYAMARNSWKFSIRDKRKEKKPPIESHYLAPDTAESLLRGRELLEEWCGRKNLLDPGYNPDEIILKKHTIEKGRRPVKIVRPARAWRLYGDLIKHYFALNLIKNADFLSSLEDVNRILEDSKRSIWHNVGGLMVSQVQLSEMEQMIGSGQLSSWQDLHDLYDKWAGNYLRESLFYSAACYKFLTGITKLGSEDLKILIHGALEREDSFINETRESREKDFTLPFRRMVYDNEKEMEAVLGKQGDDNFIRIMEEERSALSVGAEKLLQTVCSQG